MNVRVLLSCALAALLLAGCVARLPAEQLPADSGDTSALEPETIAAPDTPPTDDAVSGKDTAGRLTCPISPLTGPPPAPIHDQYPDPQKMPEDIEWDGVQYKRLDFYITDEDCAELEPKGSYTWWSDATTSHQNMIRLYSIGDLPASACVGTRFSVFEKGSLAVYVNEAEWTQEMEQEITARLVQEN